jgi:hypothetical protein
VFFHSQNSFLSQSGWGCATEFESPRPQLSLFIDILIKHLRGRAFMSGGEATKG